MKELFDYLASNGLTPNGFYVLWGIANKSRPQLINVHTELRLLESSKFIQDASKGILTDKGKEIMDKAEAMFGSLKFNKKAETTLGLDDDVHIIAYLDMFPKGKLPSGKPARLPKADIKKSFQWFFNNYEYSWDTILKATAYYLDTYEKANFLYMKNSQYFIRKQNSDKSWDSELAGYCEIILNGGDFEDDHIKEKVV